MNRRKEMEHQNKLKVTKSKFTPDLIYILQIK